MVAAALDRRSQLRAGLIAALALAATAIHAKAGPVLDRIRAEGVVRCGAEERPGIAEPKDDGTAGLAVDLCRAAALAVLGPQGRIVFTLLASSLDYDEVRQGRLDLAFLAPGAIAEEKLAGSIVPGPPVYIDRLALMVPQHSTARRAADLAGKTICFMIGSAAQRALEASFEASGLPLARLGFEEDVEMRDAYDVGRCQAVAGEATRLAVVRQDGGVNHMASRILDTPLALDPIFAATPTRDGAWSAAIAWVLDALVAASAARSGWHEAKTGLDGDAAQSLGLREHWQTDVSSRLGTYADMLGRNLGEGSDLRLAPGPNAPWPAGLLLPPVPP